MYALNGNGPVILDFFCRFRKTVKDLSTIYHDRPIGPGDELVHWVEHVIRTRGALHLRSPALSVPWYTKVYLDLITLVVVVICIVKLTIKRLLLGAFSKKKIGLVNKKRQ